jgi:hypothetical protein
MTMISSAARLPSPTGMPKQKRAPSFVQGRKGQTSVVDCIVKRLWVDENGHWPECTFAELRESATKMQGYRVSSSTIRSSVYTRGDLFERVATSEWPLRWRLTKAARKG